MRPGFVALLPAVLLLGCGSGGGGSDPAADSACIGSFVGGTDTSQNIQCTSFCGFPEDPRRAFDGDRASYAGYAWGAGSTAVLGVRAQSGVVFPAGNFAGALMLIPPAYVGTQWTISTYLDGVPQETRTPENASGDDPANPSGTDEFYGFTTSLPFDEVQLAMSGGAAAINPREVRVYEFCSAR